MKNNWILTSGSAAERGAGVLLSFLTVTNGVFSAADAGDCAFLIPVDTEDECCKWQKHGFFCSKNASETRLMSQTLISHIPDRICAGSLPAAGSDALFYPALFAEVRSVLRELFFIFPPARSVRITNVSVKWYITAIMPRFVRLPCSC